MISFKKKIFYSTIILFFLLLISFLFLETSSRLYSFFYKKNYCAKSLSKDKYSSLPDRTLGYTPKPGKKVGCLKEKYTINSKGLRHYEDYIFDKSKFLIVGDSFGFGDEVSDDETLSHMLFKNHNIRTVNAAVYGYGLDQSLLRADRFLKEKKMDVLLIIAPGGWLRVNQSVRNGIKKPYYQKVSTENLELKIPNQEKFKKSLQTHFVEKSILVRFIVSRYRLKKFLQQNVTLKDMNAIDKSCLILKNFNTKAKKNNINFDLIFYRDATELYSFNSEIFKKTNKLLNCLKKNDINYFDTFKILKKHKNSKLYVKRLYGHPNKEANLLVSNEISNYLNRRLTK